MQGELFNPDKSRKGRDEGIESVIGNAPRFCDLFIQVILRLPHGWIGTCEDIRRNWKAQQPHHPNAWGACWNRAKRLGLLVEMPQQTHMTAVKSHARKTHLYQRQ